MLSADSVKCLLSFSFFSFFSFSLTHYRRFKTLSFFFYVNIHIKALSSILPLYPHFLFDFSHIPISHHIFPPYPFLLLAGSVLSLSLSTYSILAHFVRSSFQSGKTIISINVLSYANLPRVSDVNYTYLLLINSNY